VSRWVMFDNTHVVVLCGTGRGMVSGAGDGSCNTTWGELMYRLKTASEGKSREPLFLAGELSY